jgi:hypothetical protein
VLCATDLTVTLSPAAVKNPSLIATCRPAVSSTGSDPTVMFVIAAGLPVAEALAEALAEPLAEVLVGALAEVLLELLQAVTRIAATATPAAAMGTRLSRVSFMGLLYGEGMAGIALLAMAGSAVTWPFTFV